MVFSSPIFIFLFLPIVLALYYLSPAKAKNAFLLIASLLFYTWGEDKIVLIMLLSTLVNYLSGILIDRGWRAIGLTISIVSSLLLLWVFKYFNFTFNIFLSLLKYSGSEVEIVSRLPQIVLPIGISFYTFQTLSYTIDIFRGNVKASYNFVDFATYVTMFPQLVAGPIVRYADIQRQLKFKRLTFDNFSIGVERFTLGLAKKVLIANNFALIADEVFAQNLSTLSSLHAWIGILAYSLQIYYDFSGYSDMAIGLGKMLGFDFMENFNYPYIARSIQEFWRRWHISLSTWFRDYLYIPLGGNRVSKVRTYLNLLFVFLITGLWHGASWNFIAWGLFHGIFIVIEKVGFGRHLKLSWRPMQHVYTLLIVVVGWVFFRANNLYDAFSYLRIMFSFTSNDTGFAGYFNFFHLGSETVFFTIIAIALSTPIHTYLKNTSLTINITHLRPFYFAALFVLSLIYLGADTYNPFIYFRF